MMRAPQSRRADAGAGHSTWLEFVLGLLMALMLCVAVAGGGSAQAQTLPAPNVQAPPGEGDDPYDDAAVTSYSVPSSMEAGKWYDVSVTMKNTGNTSWRQAAVQPYRLGYLAAGNQFGVGRIDLGGRTIAPGASFTFAFSVKAPATPGNYDFVYQMLVEHVRWFGQTFRRTVAVVVPAPVPNAQITALSVPTSMVAGKSYGTSVTLKNTGNVTWVKADGYRLGTSSPIDNTIWGMGRIEMGAATVAPGASTTVSFNVTAPATTGTHAYDWGMLWERHLRFGATTKTMVTVTAPAATPKPAISVSLPAMTAGQAVTLAWSTSNATSLSRVCTASGTGYAVNETVAVNGSRTVTPQAAWVNYPSNCTWKATGAGGTTTYTHTMTTAAAPTPPTTPTTPLPTISVTRPALVVGQAVTMKWSTTNATSLSRVCTASGTGYQVNETMALSGSRSITPLAAWVGYPSNCTWTATGAGGKTAHADLMTTAANVNVTYIHTDALGSPVARTDGTGNLISRTAYEPYGYTAAGVVPTLGFTGHVNDWDSGLVYMQQRYYDPVAGRFLSIDPVVTDASTGGGFNRYVYANNSPYKYIDADGRNPTMAACAAGPAGCAVGLALTAATAWYGTKAINNTRRAFQSRSAPLKNEGANAEKSGGQSGTNNGDAKPADPGDKDPSTPTGQRGSPIDVTPGTNKPTKIGDREYTGHALDQGQGRGVPPSAIEDAIRNGKTSPGNRPGTTVHIGDNGVKVVTGERGQVITVIPK